MTDAVSLDEIKAMLADRVQEVARHYAPDGKAVRGNWQACCPYRGDAHAGSFLIGLSGRHRGIAVDFAEDQRGFSLFELIRRCIGAADTSAGIVETIAEARRFLGLSQDDPAALARARERAARVAAQVAADQARASAELERKRKDAKGMFLGGLPLRRGDAAWSYLAGRGIDLGLLPGRVPGALRCHSGVFEAETQRLHPALVAAVGDPATGGFLAVHRTYLGNINGVWGKAALADPKKTWPAYAGGAISVWRGSRVPGLKAHDSERHGPLWLTEGIEDALSIALARPDRAVVATISVSNLAAIALPAAARDVVLAQDNDGVSPGEVARLAELRVRAPSEAEAFARSLANPAVALALSAALARWADEGRTVRIWRSPVGKDANDLLRAVVAA